MRACHSAGPGLVDAGAFGVDGYGDGHVLDFELHVLHLELVDGFHAEVGEGEDFAALDRLRHQADGPPTAVPPG